MDEGNSRFRVGDRVACGGAECAFHAEYIAVPDMLVGRVPEQVPMGQAAYTTLLSIAMQAVRQTEPLPAFLKPHQAASPAAAQGSPTRIAWARWGGAKVDTFRRS